MRSLPEVGPAEWALSYRHDGRTFPARLCALRRSAVAAEEERAQARESARKSRGTASARTLELAGYILILSSLPAAEASTRELLELYRLRWQVELAFKRLKSLLQIGHLHTYDPAFLTSVAPGQAAHRAAD